MEIQEHVLLAPLTTFKLGGPARYFVVTQTVEEIREAFVFAREHNLKVFLLGGGSNTLVPDEGFDGVVIKIEITGIRQEGAVLIAGAGENWDSVVEAAIKANLWGIENLSGVPGTVGGAVVQNIGAYGAALSQTLAWVEVLDSASGEVKKMSVQECKLGYRDSIFKEEVTPTLGSGSRPERRLYVIIRAAFELSTTPQPNISYKDLANCGTLNITQMRQKVLSIRRAKFPDLAAEGTAGSFFKNPILSPAQAKSLRVTYPDMPLFAMPETAGIKIPLAWLLDKEMKLKGLTVGGARLFEKQPLVIVAHKGASSKDIVALAEDVHRRVKEKTGIEIEPEVKIL